MEKHLRLIDSIDSISPLLAIRSLQLGESVFDSHDGSFTMTCTPLRPGHDTRQVIDEHGVAFLEATNTHDITRMSLTACAPEVFMKTLACLGMKAGVLVLDLEEFDRRASEIDAAWSLLKTLRFRLHAQRPVPTALRLLSFAREWSTLRLKDFEGKLRCDEDKRRSELALDIDAVKRWSDVRVSDVQLHHDPRGSCFTLTSDENGAQVWVTSLTLNWPIGTVGAPPAAAVDSTEAASTLAGVSKPTAAAPLPAKLLPRPTKVDAKLMAVLSEAIVEANSVRLTRQLPPALYRKVSAFLLDLGGRWHTGKSAHIFDGDVEELFAQILATGTVLTRKDYEFFATQPPEAARLVQLLGLRPGMKVMEPHAGDGALAMAAAEVVGRENVTCYELMPQNCETLCKLGFAVEGPRDFLQVDPIQRYDAILMNPPFSGGRDVVHVNHALKFLTPGGLLGAITSRHWCHSQDTASTAFRDMVDAHALANLDIDAGAFKAVGTEVATKMIVLPAQTHDEVLTANSQQSQTQDAPRAKREALDTFTIDLFA